MPLHVANVRGTEPSARRLLMLHGILGQGLNWRGVARRLVQALPTLEVTLVDLRAHGGSRDLPPPDDLSAAAKDLHPLLDGADAVLGHSFGGKVALELVRQRPDALRALFVVDSLPGDRPDRRGSEGTERVVDMLAELPARFEDRDAFVAHVVGEGHREALAAWLAQSLDRLDDGGFTFGLDVARIRALLDDYFARDLWPVIDPPPAGLTVDLVVGGRSTVWAEDDRARGRALAESAPRVRFHLLEEADHWVHVDDPDGLQAILVEGLS